MFRAVSLAQSLADLTDLLDGVGKQYAAVRCPNHNPALPLRTEGPLQVMLLCKAASRCLTLLHQEAGINQDAVLLMPSQPATVTTVRMVLHILAHCMYKWMASVRSNAEHFRDDSSKVERAVRQAGECAAYLGNTEGRELSRGGDDY